MARCVAEAFAARILILAAVAACSPSATLELRGGRVISGELLRSNASAISVRVGSSTEETRRSEISEVDLSGNVVGTASLVVLGLGLTAMIVGTGYAIGGQATDSSWVERLGEALSYLVATPFLAGGGVLFLGGSVGAIIGWNQYAQGKARLADDPNTGFRPRRSHPDFTVLGFQPPTALEVQCGFGRVCLEHPSPDPGFDHRRCVSPCAERHPDGQATRLPVEACKTGDEIRDALEREFRQASIDSPIRPPLRSVLSQIADLFTHSWFTLSPTNPVDFRDAPPTAVFGVCPDQAELAALGVSSFPSGGLNDTCEYQP